MRTLIKIGSLLLLVAGVAVAANVEIPPAGGGGGGSITEVDGTTPIVVASGTTLPVISIIKSDATHNGYVSSTDWGTFNGKQSTLSASSSSVNGYLSSTDWTTFNGKQATLSAASSSVNGYLSSTDWSTFNGKQATIGVTAPVTLSGATVAITQAATAANGYLSSTDWNTFNGKQAALGFTAVNKGGDTMSGQLVLPANGLIVGTTQLTVGSSKVGLGTASPSYQLTVDGGSAGPSTGMAVLEIHNTGGSTTGPTIRLDTDAGRNWRISSGSNTDAMPSGFQIIDASLPDVTRLGIDTNGNVGLGTTGPTARLEVNGGVRIHTATVRPTCDSTLRGTQWIVEGAGGVTDTLYVCLKAVADTYSWITITTGG